MVVGDRIRRLRRDRELTLVRKEVTDAELTLIQFLRRTGVAPDEALARLVG
jgi:hypothetical protein